MKTLFIAEHNNQTLRSSSFHALSAAKELDSTVDMLVIGYQCSKVVEEAQKLALVNKILLADKENYKDQLAENSAVLINEIAKDYDYIIIPSTTFGKNLLPRVAALLDVAMFTDVIKIVSEDTFQRPIYAGNAIETIKSEDKIKLLAIRTTSFNATNISETTNCEVEMLNQDIPNTLSSFVSQDLTKSARPELSDAKIVISGGRGLKTAENFKLLEKLADKYGAALGASRAAVDAGFAPNDYQVGQTGKVVAPDLYIAIGISGAIQHLAGIKDSKVIVAINNDPEAPIFKSANYGIVGDLFGALKEFDSE